MANNHLDKSAVLEGFKSYSNRLQHLLDVMDWEPVVRLSELLLECKQHHRQIFICGNGGSAGNAIHIANDLIYGAGGFRVEALPANTAVLTCLANDISYEDIYSEQLKIKGNEHDVLIVLSGSGNSGNIIRAVETAKTAGMKTAAILGYSGGQCKSMVDIAIHAPIDDMQISEDIQLVVGHMMMQYFSKVSD